MKVIPFGLSKLHKHTLWANCTQTITGEGLYQALYGSSWYLAYHQPCPNYQALCGSCWYLACHQPGLFVIPCLSSIRSHLPSFMWFFLIPCMSCRVIYQVHSNHTHSDALHWWYPCYNFCLCDRCRYTYRGSWYATDFVKTTFIYIEHLKGVLMNSTIISRSFSSIAVWSVMKS